MGLTVQRKIARKLERLVFPNIPPENDWAFLKPSLAQKILIKGVKPTKTVYITPYLLSGVARTNMLNDRENGYEWDNDPELDIGGDVKFSVTNNLTMDFTVNTDFAQVEADDQLINLSRFSLFFPEKRQFFQERSAVFEFRTGGLSRLFFSRRIGLTDDGMPVPIIGGVRLTGRINTWDVGALNMQTRNFDSFESENFGVFRIKRRVLNEQSTIGAIFTSRIGRNGGRNIAYGVDGLIRLFGDDFLAVKWSQTFDETHEDRPQRESLNNGRLTLELNRRRRAGFGYNIGAIYSGADYLPRMGFVGRNNFKFATGSLSHTRLFPEDSAFIWQTFDLTGSVYVDNDDEAVESADIGPQWKFSTRTLDSGHLGFKWVYENLSEEFALSDEVMVPIGDYRFARF